MPARYLSWEEICGTPPLTSWAAVRARWAVDAILFARTRVTDGYRVSRVGLLPALLVLPQAWHGRLPEEVSDAAPHAGLDRGAGGRPG
jgi:hypothetical protein